jgi:putative endopeptidase
MHRLRWILAAAVLCSTTGFAATPTPAGIGIDLKGIDHGVKPGDNFFRYANGDWLKSATIPADRSSIGTFFTVFKQAQKQTAALIKGAAEGNPPAGSNQRKIADFYAAYMNTDAIEKHGLAPLKPQLDAIDAIASRQDLARVLGSRLRQDVDPINATDFHTVNLFGLFVAQGLTDPSHNIAYLLQGGLSMPSRDYYLSSDKTMVSARDKYKAYIAALLKQAGTPDASAAATRVFDLETKIAQAQESLVDSQDPHKANNLWSVADFSSKAPGLDWNTYFKAATTCHHRLVETGRGPATGGVEGAAALPYAGSLRGFVAQGLC